MLLVTLPISSGEFFNACTGAFLANTVDPTMTVTLSVGMVFNKLRISSAFISFGKTKTALVGATSVGAASAVVVATVVRIISIWSFRVSKVSKPELKKL